MRRRLPYLGRSPPTARHCWWTRRTPRSPRAISLRFSMQATAVTMRSSFGPTGDIQCGPRRRTLRLKACRTSSMCDRYQLVCVAAGRKRSSSRSSMTVPNRSADYDAGQNDGSPRMPQRLRSARPQLPKALHNRPADNWRPLLAIADVAGGEWPKQARRAAETLSVVAEPPQSKGCDVALGYSRYLRRASVLTECFSSDLATALVALEGRPWGERNGHGPYQRQCHRGHAGAVWNKAARHSQAGRSSVKAIALNSLRMRSARYLPKQNS